jgi:hypothetical protein
MSLSLEGYVCEVFENLDLVIYWILELRTLKINLSSFGPGMLIYFGVLVNLHPF